MSSACSEGSSPTASPIRTGAGSVGKSALFVNFFRKSAPGSPGGVFRTPDTLASREQLDYALSGHLKPFALSVESQKKAGVDSEFRTTERDLGQPEDRKPYISKFKKGGGGFTTHELITELSFGSPTPV